MNGLKKNWRPSGSRQQKAYDRAVRRGEIPDPEAVVWDAIVDIDKAMQTYKDDFLVEYFRIHNEA